MNGKTILAWAAFALVGIAFMTGNAQRWIAHFQEQSAGVRTSVTSGGGGEHEGPGDKDSKHEDNDKEGGG